MPYEWDDEKAEANELKHGVTFEYAAELLDGDYVAYRARVKGETRYKAVARDRGEYFAVVYTERGGDLRIISARHATDRERSCYERDFR